MCRLGNGCRVLDWFFRRTDSQLVDRSPQRLESLQGRPARVGGQHNQSHAKQESTDPPKDFTVGHIHTVLVRRLKIEGKFEEDSSHVMEANLQEVISRLRSHFPLWTVTPDAEFESLMGRPLHRSDWTALGELFAVDMPPVAWSSLTQFSIVGGLLVSLGIWVWLAYCPSRDSGLLALVGIPVMGFLIAWQWTRESQRFPPQLRRVSDLADHVLMEHLRRNPSSRWSDELVWFMLREVLVDTLGVDHHEVTPTATVFHDLGAG